MNKNGIWVIIAKRRIIIPPTCKSIFIFPQTFALISSFSAFHHHAAAIKERSMDIIIMVVKKKCFKASIIITDPIRSLSAKGSYVCPQTVIWLRTRAKLPSRASVNAVNMKSIAPISNFSNKKSAVTIGVKIKRATVMWLGIIHFGIRGINVYFIT